MAHAVFSASMLAELPIAPASEWNIDPSAPLVPIGQSPVDESASPALWSTGTLSAWAPANRANPICEIRQPPARRPWIAVGGALVLLVTGAMFALTA